MSTIEAPPASISQHKLRQLETLEAQAKEYAELKAEVIRLLDAGVKVQEGRLMAMVAETKTTNIAWKQEFEKVDPARVALISKREKGKATRRSLVLGGRK